MSSFQAHIFSCQHLDLQSSSGIAEVVCCLALQSAQQSLLQAEQTMAVKESIESPLQPLNPVSGHGSSSKLVPEEKQVAVADPDEAVCAGQKPREEGQNTLKARAQYLQQDIDRLVSCQKQRGAAYTCESGKASSDPGLAFSNQLKIQANGSAT